MAQWSQLSVAPVRFSGAVVLLRVFFLTAPLLRFYLRFVVRVP